MNKQILKTKVERLIGEDHYIAAIIRDIPAQNEICIQDGVSKSAPITQMTGVLQGDPLSPLLFSTVTTDVTHILQDGAGLYMLTTWP